MYFTENFASAGTKFSYARVTIDKEAQNPKNGKVAVTWYPVPKATGYLIEKYDTAKETWVTQKNIKKASTTSYTFPASPLGRTVEYRIRAYSGKKYSSAASVNVTGKIAAVTGVKAKSAGNGITVSWKAVSGASYYKVYRTTNSGATYNADTKTYGYNGGEQVSIMVFKPEASTSSSYYYTLGNSKTKMWPDSDAADKLGYDNDSSQIKGTSVTDYSYATHSLRYDNNGKVTRDDVDTYGPQSDVTYYYYVVAYRELKDAKGTTTASSYGCSKAASASMAGSAAVKAPSIKVKAGSKKATISYKKVKNAKKYLIYRSDSKKGAFKLVGTTTKTKYTDKKLTSKKTYGSHLIAVCLL